MRVWARLALCASAGLFASTTVASKLPPRLDRGTGPGAISIGAVTYGYPDFAAEANATWQTAGPVGHLYEGRWYYRVGGDTREFPITGVPDDSSFVGDTISVSYRCAMC